MQGELLQKQAEQLGALEIGPETACDGKQQGRAGAGLQQSQQLVAAQGIAGAGGQCPAQIGQGLGIGVGALLLLADALQQGALQSRGQGGIFQALAQGIEGRLRQPRQGLAYQGKIAFILQPLREIGEALQSQALPSLFPGRRQVVAERLVVGGRCLLQLAGQLGVQARHLGLRRPEGVGVVGEALGLLFIQFPGELVAQGLDHLIHKVLGAARDEQAALIERKLEEPEIVFRLGWLEEVHAEPGMLL